MVLLHAFIKKTQKTPKQDLELALDRKSKLEAAMTNNNPHIGSSFDDFLDEENLLVEANEIAIERVIAWQLQQEIESKHMTLPIYPGFFKSF